MTKRTPLGVACGDAASALSLTIWAELEKDREKRAALVMEALERHRAAAERLVRWLELVIPTPPAAAGPVRRKDH